MSTDWIARAETLTFRTKNFVGGERRSGRGAEWQEKYGPRDGKLLCELSVSTAEDVHEAVSGAKQAFVDGRWSQQPAERRKECLQSFASLVKQHREELALLECVDVGKPITEALTFDVPTAAALIQYNAEALDKIHSRVYATDRTSLSYQLRRPLGVAAAIVGWNFPLVLAAAKVGAVLATGNSLVLKPSELTFFSASRLAELAVEAGIPEGVLNVVHGDAGVGAALSVHPDVDLITFTGSTSTGKKLLVAAGQSNMKRLILECGGKAPNIVFDDYPDLDSVAESVVARAFWNQGEVCTASSRLLIQSTIKQELMARVIAKVATLKLGDPLDPSTKFGAVVSKAHRQKILHYIDTGTREGARIVYQSNAPVPHMTGFYVGPVIFDNVSSGHRIAQEEIFGPVLSVLEFRDEQEAIGIANDTVYGLSAILWTKDVGRAHRVSQGIKAGWIIVNATGRPTGGPSPGALSIGGHKESGMGVEGGLEGLEEYMSRTVVQVFV